MLLLALLGSPFARAEAPPSVVAAPVATTPPPLPASTHPSGARVGRVVTLAGLVAGAAGATLFEVGGTLANGYGYCEGPCNGRGTVVTMVYVGGGAVVAGTWAYTAGTLVEGAALRRHGYPVRLTAGWLAVAGTTTATAITLAPLVTDMEGALLLAILPGAGAWVAASVQYKVNVRGARAGRTLAVSAAPGGLRAVGAW